MKLKLNESGYIKDAYKTRVVPTGLSNPLDKEVIESVIGQMSDGMWENSSRMEPYWKELTTDEDNGKLIFRIYPHGVYWKMQDADVLTYFANKIKQVVKQEEKDNPGEGLEWRRDNNTELEYMHSPITVADAYRVYDKLLNRPDRSPKIDFIVKNFEDVVPGDKIKDKVVKEVARDSANDKKVIITFEDGSTINPWATYDKVKVLTESISATPHVDDLLAAIEGGLVDWETVGMAALKYMSDDDVKEMCELNDFNIGTDFEE